MKKFQAYISAIFVITSSLGIIMTLKNLGMSEAQYYGTNNDNDTTTMGEFITGIFIWSIPIQIVVYFILFIYHLFVAVKIKDRDSLMMIKIFCFSIFLGMIWVLMTLILIDNGKHDLLWGPADTGLFFVSISSLFINYLIFSYNIVNAIVRPSKLYTVIKGNRDNGSNI